MPSVTIEACPSQNGRPPHVKVKSPDMELAEMIVLLERAKAVLLTQPIPSLDGEPQQVVAAPPHLVGKLTSAR